MLLFFIFVFIAHELQYRGFVRFRQEWQRRVNFDFTINFLLLVNYKAIFVFLEPEGLKFGKMVPVKISSTPDHMAQCSKCFFPMRFWPWADGAWVKCALSKVAQLKRVGGAVTSSWLIQDALTYDTLQPPLPTYRKRNSKF